jgi:hypothetical protein
VRGFINVWAGGHLALLGDVQTLFTPDLYYAWLKQQIPSLLALRTWSYPPSMLFVVVPFAGLGLVPGIIAFGVATLALFVALARLARLPLSLCAVIALSPAALENALAGQNGALTAAFLVGGLLLAETRPVLAGLLLGFLSMKPQFCLLLPLCLLAQRNWRAIGAATVSSITLTLASGLVFGWEAWRLFFTQTTPFMTHKILELNYGHSFQFMMATPFILARSVGLNVGQSYAVQAVFIVGAMIFAWRAWSLRGANPQLRMAMTVCLTLLATPYALSYDLVAVAAAVVVIAQEGLQNKFRPGETASLVFLWLWPGCAFLLGQAGMPSVGALLILSLAVYAWLRLRVTPQTASEYPPDHTASRRKSL